MQFPPRRALVCNIYKPFEMNRGGLGTGKNGLVDFFFFLITPLVLYKDMDYKTRIAVFNSSKNCVAV